MPGKDRRAVSEGLGDKHERPFCKNYEAVLNQCLSYPSLLLLQQSLSFPTYSLGLWNVSLPRNRYSPHVASSGFMCR